MRTLSESEERKFDNAVSAVEQYARQASIHEDTSPLPPASPAVTLHGEGLGEQSNGVGADSDSNSGSTSSSKKLRSVFRKKKSSAKASLLTSQQRATFTEEIARKADASDDIGLDAQEAYNELIGRGSIKRSVTSATSQSEVPPERPPPVAAVRPSRGANLNIRAPIIPGRTGGSTGASQGHADAEHLDSNPLRQLRSANTAFIPGRGGKSGPKFPSSSGSGPKTAPKPQLSANSQFFDKLKEQERERSESNSANSSEEGTLHTTVGARAGSGGEETGGDTSVNCIPLPPRSGSLRSSLTSAARHQRKYPLDISKTQQPHAPADAPAQWPQSVTSSYWQQSNGHDLNSTRDSDDSVFSESSPATSSVDVNITSRAPPPLPAKQRVNSSQKPFLSSLPLTSSYSGRYNVTSAAAAASTHFAVKSVKLTARDLGYQDTGDSFWSKDVSLHEFGDDPTEGGAVIAGRYKTSDTVSYEDLLDFALDGVSERSA